MDSRLCVAWNGRVWWEFRFWRTDSFLGKRKVGWENKNFGFLYTSKLWFYSQRSTRFTTISHFHCTQYNVQFFFLSTACGVKPALQLRFFAKPDSASNENLPFRTVQNMAVRICGTYKISQKILMRRTFQNLPKTTPHGFWTALWVSRGSQPSGLLLVTFRRGEK